MSIEVGNLMVLDDEQWIVESVKSSTIKIFDVEESWDENIRIIAEELVTTGYVDDDGDVWFYDDEDKKVYGLTPRLIANRICGSRAYDDYKIWRWTSKWDKFCDVCDYFQDIDTDGMDFKLVNTQLIKMTNLKNMEQKTCQYFINEDGKQALIEDDANIQPWGEYMEDCSAVFVTNDDCWEIANLCFGLNDLEEYMKLKIL